MIAEAAKICKGEFASGIIPGDVDSDMTRVMTSCEGSRGAKTALFLITPRSTGGHYVFITYALGATNAPAQKADENIRAVLLRQ
jgi:hypothetical protein